MAAGPTSPARIARRPALCAAAHPARDQGDSAASRADPGSAPAPGGFPRARRAACRSARGSGRSWHHAFTIHASATVTTIKVFQGEREMAADNKQLGNFDLTGIPPAPRGVPQIEVTFDIDANGIVSVSAKDKATGKEQQIRIQAKSGLSDADIERMVRDAEANADADRKRRETVEARNQLDALVHSTDKTLKENGDKVGAAEKAEVETALAEARGAMEGQDADAIRAASEKLSQAAMKMGEALYKAQQAAEQQAGGAPGQGGANPNDKVVDAEFEEVDPNKKKPS
ncbi:Hsp70 family protein [Leptolyngbya sp. 15MV]|nr:Hsp70 family protein [Leptolyngbya sp. 15MV]